VKRSHLRTIYVHGRRGIFTKSFGDHIGNILMRTREDAQRLDSKSLKNN
jgi:hypothetical protein